MSFISESHKGSEERAGLTPRRRRRAVQGRLPETVPETREVQGPGRFASKHYCDSCGQKRKACTCS